MSENSITSVYDAIDHTYATCHTIQIVQALTTNMDKAAHLANWPAAWSPSVK